MKIYKTKWFTRFTRRERITDTSLRKAVKQMELGTIDADLGSGIIKQRLAREGKGKSGGYRILLIFQVDDKAVIFYGFAKNVMANIDNDQMETMKEIAALWLAATNVEIERALKIGELTEVAYDEEE